MTTENSCFRCGLAATYPGADLDGSGGCRPCRDVGGRVYPSLGDEALRELVAHRAGDSRWACVVGYSGGKDSTYMLRRLAEWFPGRVLAYTFDTQVMSPGVWANIDRVVARLGVEWIKDEPAPGFMHQMFRRILGRLVASRNGTLYSRSSVELGPLCWPCGTLYHLGMLRTARDRGVATVTLGFTPSQDSSHYAEGRQVEGEARALHQARHAPRGQGIAAREYITMSWLIFRLIEEVMGKESAAPYRLDRDDPGLQGVRMVRFYDHAHYDETVVRRGAAEVGFEHPDDTGYGSTNCAINPLVRHIHSSLYGFDKYMAQDAALVRWGFGTREEVAARVEPLPGEAAVRAACARVGLTLEELEAILRPDPAV